MTQKAPLPDYVAEALNEILEYLWWTEKFDLEESNGLPRPGFDHHIFSALKVVAAWIGWSGYEYDPSQIPDKKS